MSFPPAVALRPKIPMPGGWPKSRVGSPSLKDGKGHGYPLCVLPALLSSPPPPMVLDPFADASQGPLLIPSTSPPPPFLPSPSQLPLAQYLLHPQITATGRPLCRLYLGDAHLPRGNREPHIPQRGLGPPLVTEVLGSGSVREQLGRAGAWRRDLAVGSPR